MIHDDILSTIGHTPTVRLNRIGSEHSERKIELFAKLEFFNPMASVKDRLAVGIIEDAERRGTLKPGQTVVEATSGNTGIALAMVCAAKGYPFVALMVETFSIERRKLMRALGAKVILTPKEEKGTGMVKRAAALAERNGWFLARQFENEANPIYHANTTAPEILRDFAHRRLDYFVTAWGTGGTMTGAGKVLKQARPDLKVIATEPAGAALLSGKDWTPHKIQGWTPDFVPKVLDRSVADRIVPVTDEEARDMAQRMAREEGIFTGISGGGAVAAMVKVAEEAPDGSTLVAVVADTGERYLSTFLFENVNEDSDRDWLIEQGYADDDF